MSYDTVIIGAGHNGLTASLYLAKAGQKVLVVDRADQPGGLCRSEEFHEGFHLPGVLHETGGVRDWIIEELGLDQYGLARCQPETPTLVPSEKGDDLLLYSDPDRIEGPVSEGDLAAYRGWQRFVEHYSKLITDLADQAPPYLETQKLGDSLGLLKTGLSFRRLGKKKMHALLRVAPMSVRDWMEEHFQNPLLATALAAPGLLGSFVGPFQAGTALNLLLHLAVLKQPLRGGPSVFVESLVSAAKARGVELRLEAAVDRIQIRNGRAVGIKLGSGEEIEATNVLSTCDPKQTFLQLVHPSYLSVDTLRRFRAVRARGVAAKVHLALNSLPQFAGHDGIQFERVRLGAETLLEIERAFDAPKYREYSSQPFLEIWIPSIADPALAPPGKHVASVLVHCAPYDLKGGWTTEQRDTFYEVVIDTIARYSPGISEQIEAAVQLSPVDLEQQYGLTNGHLYHAETGLDQALFMRPTYDTGRYTTPVPGLYLGGSGSHPGGGVSGVPGALAARQLLNE